MTNYTRDDLFRILKGSDELKEMGASEDSIRSAVSQLITTFIDVYGLEVNCEVPNFKDYGAPRHQYKGEDIMRCLREYTDKVKSHKQSIRKVAANQILSAMEFWSAFKTKSTK